MILVDTSVWIDHLHASDAELVRRLESWDVGTHPWVIGELALGSIRNHSEVLAHLGNLPAPQPAAEREVLWLVEQRKLFGLGLSLVDAHLLASVLITPGWVLWTRDKRLRRVAEDLGVGVRIA